VVLVAVLILLRTRLGLRVRDTVDLELGIGSELATGFGLMLGLGAVIGLWQLARSGGVLDCADGVTLKDYILTDKTSALWCNITSVLIRQ